MSARSISADLIAALKRLRLGGLLPTLAERFTLAEKEDTPYEDLLLMLLVDEISRRDSTASIRRAEQAGLEPDMVLERWDKSAKVTYDRRVMNELVSLRFVEDHRNAVVLGPVGVGKTFLANALGHLCCRAGFNVRLLRADALLRWLKQSRMDNSREAVMTELATVDVLIIDDFALEPKGLAALRHGEAASLRWRQYDQILEPLGALNLEHTKSGIPRRVPVHRVLARLLAEWKLAGFERTLGRAPAADDLVVPTRNFTERQSPESQVAFLGDLKLLGLRRRRGHDLRRTFITLAQVDGARRDLLETVTHGPRGDIINIYTSFPWPALCDEVAKLKIELREGTVLDGDFGGLATPFATRERTARKRWVKGATPAGHYLI